MAAFELWGATDVLALTFPSSLLEYVLLALYGLILAYVLYRYRDNFGELKLQQWALVIGLSLVSFLVSQLFPIRFSFDDQLSPLSVAQNPVTTLTLFAAAPFLLAGAVFNPIAALIVGLFSGLGRALGQTHHVYTLFHFAFAAVLAAACLQQNYFGRIYQWLRHPVISGAASTASVTVLLGLATFATSDVSASNLASLDLALSTAAANFWPLLIEGAVGGGIVSVTLMGLPHLRPQRAFIPSPAQRSLRRRLLTNFAVFALLLTVLLAGVVFHLSVRVSTRLVINQMAHNAQTVSAAIPDFQAQLQNLLTQYNENERLLSNNGTESENTLKQMFRVSPMYRRILLVDRDQTVNAFYPTDVDSISLTELERSAVDRVLATSTTDIAATRDPTDEHVLSFIVPVFDDKGAAAAVLVGRVPELSLNNLIVGLQGTVGQGTGFIVDENQRIIAHPDSSRLRDRWTPPVTGSRLLDAEQTAPGVAYQGRQEQTNARELGFYVPGTDHPWTVVITVPYEVVLSLALSIGAPLTLVLLVVMGLFYANLAVLGSDITRPITELVEASKTIASGDNWSPPTTYIQREDEVGQLNKAFAQMQRSMKQRLNELSLLLGVSHDVSAGMDITQGMPAILRGALRGTGAAGARAAVLNPSGGRPLTFGEGSAARAMAVLDRQIMIRLRHTNELLLATPEQIRKQLRIKEKGVLPVPALIAVPLRSHGRFQGILWLGYRQPQSFDMTELNLLQTLAGQAAVLVENARLFATAEGGRRRLAAVLASTSDAVIVTDQTERILLINRATEKIFHLKANDVIGRPVADVIQVKPLVSALTGDDEHVQNLEIPANDDKTYYASASTIISNDGQVMGRVAVLHDITHYKEIDEMKSDFVATVSHDLRSPLTFMRGYATMLPMVGELNEKQGEYAEKILNGIDQMSQLVDDLLDLGRIEAGVELQNERVELLPLLADIANEHWQHAHMNGIKLEVDVEPEIPVIQGDSALIRQAITNLVHNGIKYAPNSGTMELKAEKLDGEIVISVQDHGPGIPKEAQIRLFEKFFRIKRRGTEKVKGSGLGLAIVKSIAERHGGRAWCRSQRGQGSTFYISLPIQPEENNQK